MQPGGGGPLAGQTLAALAGEYGAALLGHRVLARGGRRFPLLIKLLDTSQWLSVQVHPDDAQAERLAGPAHLGKTEAWHILDAAQDARIIAGVQPNTPPVALACAIEHGTVLDWLQYLPVRAGDTVFTRAGTLHALGPGLLLYEIQQASDLTYRVFDWNRAGRQLHIAQSLAVMDPQAVGQVSACPPPGDGVCLGLTRCAYFTLEMVSAHTRPVALDTAGETFHVLTAVEGHLRVVGDDWQEELTPFESLLIPAAARQYEVQPRGQARALKASVQ